MRRLISLIFLLFIITFTLLLTARSQPSEKLFGTQRINFGMSDDIVYESNNDGKTWRKTKDGIYFNLICSFEYIDSSYGTVKGGPSDLVIPMKTLPAVYGYLLFNSRFVPAWPNRIEYIEYNNRIRYGAGICSRISSSAFVFMVVRRTLGSMTYSGMLIGYDYIGDWNGTWQSWTLRAIEGEPFLGDLANNAGEVFQTPGNLPIPLAFLLHLFLMVQVLQTIYPNENRHKAYIIAMLLTLCVFSFFVLATTQIFSVSQKYFALIRLVMVIDSSVITAFLGWRIARMRQFSELFQRRFAIVAGAVASIVPFCWIAGWWSWVFVAVALYTFLYYRQALYQYMEIQGGYKAASWTINVHVLKIASIVPLCTGVLIAVWLFTSYSTVYWSIASNMEKIGFYSVTGISLLITILYIRRFPYEFLVGGNKKKHGNDAINSVELESWKNRKWGVWLLGLLFMLMLLWLAQYEIFLLNNTGFGAIILR